jgi:peroxiredoxin
VKKILVSLSLLLIAGLASYALWFDRHPAPDASVRTLSGQQTSIRALRGRTVLVNFWATNCPGCVEEMPRIKQMAEQYGPQGFTVLAVATRDDQLAYIQAFVSKNQLPFMVAFDADGQIAKAFGDIQLVPTSFLIDRRGEIIKRYLGVMDFKQIRQLIERDLQH